MGDGQWAMGDGNFRFSISNSICPSPPLALCPLPFAHRPSPIAHRPSPMAHSSGPHDAAEADVAGGRINGLGKPCSRAIAAAVVRRAQVRATLEDLPRDRDGGLAGIVAVFRTRTSRVARNAARL